MKKQLTNTTVYELNKSVKLKVVNKPLIDIDTGEQYGYDTVVTVTITPKFSQKSYDLVVMMILLSLWRRLIMTTHSNHYL